MRRPSSEADEASQKAAGALQQDLTRRLASHLTRLRTAKGWGQEEAAWRSNVAIRAYQRLESGGDVNPTLSTLARLCVAYEVDLRDLFTPTPIAPRRSPGRPKGKPNVEGSTPVSAGDAPGVPKAEDEEVSRPNDPT